jgi:rod shape-determining protein MreD
VRDGAEGLRWALLLTVGLVAQVTVLTDLRIVDVHPDVMLLLAVCAGVAAGPNHGVGVGFAAGLLLDLFLPGRFGVAALSFGVAGFVAGVAGDAVIRPSRWISAAIVAVCSAGGVLLYAVLSHLLGRHTLSDPHLVPIVGIVAAVNALLAMPSLAACRWAAGDPTVARLR